jgi:2-dehydro-3-deoxygalactonokinase
MEPRADWIAVDWGTSHLRVWAMGSDGTLRGKASSDRGIGTLGPGQCEAALLDLAAPWLGAGPVPVVACGMVGARQGWAEAPYRPVPCPPLGGSLTAAPCSDARLSLGIVPGLSQASPPDVMRGEETQIAGFLGRTPDFDGVLCLPGSHTKWVQVSAGEVVSFQSFLTGELFAALSRSTVLRHSVAAEGEDGAAFAEAVAETLSRPERLAARLFSLRAADLLEGASPASARARLSGLLIGAELSAARPYWLGQNVVVIGNDAAVARYAKALAAQGLAPETVDAELMTLAGLARAHAGAGR